MGRIFEYSITDTVGWTAAGTLAYYTAPSTMVGRLREAIVGDSNNATNQQLTFYWALITALGTPTATTITPAEHEQGGPAASGTCKMLVAASEPTYSVTQIFGRDSVPMLAGYRYDPLDKGPIIAPSASYGLYLATSTFTSFKPSIRLVIEEIG